MREATLEEQLERVRVWSRFQRKKLKQFSGLDIKALRAVLDQRDRMRAALDEIKGEIDGFPCSHGDDPKPDDCSFCSIRSTIASAIHPETPVEEGD